jgi:hypothetical protein
MKRRKRTWKNLAKPMFIGYGAEFDEGPADDTSWSEWRLGRGRLGVGQSCGCEREKGRVRSRGGEKKETRGDEVVAVIAVGAATV